MKRLALSVSEKCNNNCVYCFLRAKEAEESKLMNYHPVDLEEAKKMMDRELTKGDWVILSGNEPLMNPDLPRIAGYAKSKGIKVELKTNGTLLQYKKLTLKISKLVDVVVISLISHLKEVHDEITQSKSHAHTMSGIVNCLEYIGPERVVIAIVLTRKNIGHIEEMIGSLIALGVKQYQFNFLFSGDPKLVLSIEELKDPIERIGSQIIRSKCQMQFYSFPLCALGSYHSYATELRAPETIEAMSKISDSKELRLYAKRKWNRCEHCALDNKCEGVWFPYYELYKNDEEN